MLAILALALTTTVASLALAVEATRRYGRVLVRLEALERGPAGFPGARSLTESRIERHGLKAGTPAPRIDLPDLDGRRVDLDDFRGRSLLVVFSDPHCGPCEVLAPYLAELARSHRDNGLGLVMVSRGDAAENRRKAAQHGFNFPVVLQRRWELSKEFGIFATPVGFLIGPDGVIAHDVGIGADGIMALVTDMVPINSGEDL